MGRYVSYKIIYNEETEDELYNDWCISDGPYISTYNDHIHGGIFTCEDIQKKINELNLDIGHVRDSIEKKEIQMMKLEKENTYEANDEYQICIKEMDELKNELENLPEAIMVYSILLKKTIKKNRSIKIRYE
jgi:predicted  nucleic acid-binding Zn-ribbon protein